MGTVETLTGISVSETINNNDGALRSHFPGVFFVTETYVHQWFNAFLTTLILELPVYLWCLRKSSLRGWPSFVVFLGANAITHPTLWFVVPYFSPYWMWLLVCEVGVCAAETFLIAAAFRFRSAPQIDFRVAAFTSVCANSLSAIVGLFLST